MTPMLISSVPVALALAFWMWMFSDMAKDPNLTPQERNAWFLAFLFLNVIAAASCYVTIYRRR